MDITVYKKGQQLVCWQWRLRDARKTEVTVIIYTCSISGWVGESHTGHGFGPWPWWDTSLDRFFKPLRCFVPKWRALSHNFGQLPLAVTTWAIKGAFRAHVSNLWSLSIFLVVFFMSVGSVESASVRRSVKQCWNGIWALCIPWQNRETRGHLTVISWQLHQFYWNQLNLRSVAFAKMWASFEAGRIWHCESQGSQVLLYHFKVLLANSPMNDWRSSWHLFERIQFSHSDIAAAQGECSFYYR